MAYPYTLSFAQSFLSLSFAVPTTFSTTRRLYIPTRRVRAIGGPSDASVEYIVKLKLVYAGLRKHLIPNLSTNSMCQSRLCCLYRFAAAGCFCTSRLYPSTVNLCPPSKYPSERICVIDSRREVLYAKS